MSYTKPDVKSIGCLKSATLLTSKLQKKFRMFKNFDQDSRHTLTKIELPCEKHDITHCNETTRTPVFSQHCRLAPSKLNIIKVEFQNLANLRANDFQHYSQYRNRIDPHGDLVVIIAKCTRVLFLICTQFYFDYISHIQGT